MTIKCNNCGFENQDDYDYCAKCGIPLVEGMKPRQFYVYKAQEPKLNKRNILITYIITIFLSWGGVFRIFHAILSSSVKTPEN